MADIKADDNRNGRPPDRPAHGDNARVILVVEDDPSVARVLGLSLRTSGYAVATAASGGAALQAMADAPPDGVVLDLGLPDGLGGAVLARVREMARTPSRAPVLVVTSALDREEATRRYGPLGQHFLAKPFDPLEIVGLLDRLLQDNERRQG